MVFPALKGCAAPLQWCEISILPYGHSPESLYTHRHGTNNVTKWIVCWFVYLVFVFTNCIWSDTNLSCSSYCCLVQLMSVFDIQLMSVPEIQTLLKTEFKTVSWLVKESLESPVPFFNTLNCLECRAMEVFNVRTQQKVFGLFDLKMCSKRNK